MPRHRMYRRPLSRELGTVGKATPPRSSPGSERLQDTLSVPSVLRDRYPDFPLGTQYALGGELVSTIHYHVHAATKCQRHSLALAFKTIRKQGPLRHYRADRFDELATGVICYRVVGPDASHLALESYLRFYDLLDRCSYAEASELKASGGREDIQPRPIPKGPNYLAADERERRKDREMRPKPLLSGPPTKAVPITAERLRAMQRQEQGIVRSDTIGAIVTAPIPPFPPLDQSSHIAPVQSANPLPPFLVRPVYVPQRNWDRENLAAIVRHARETGSGFDPSAYSVILTGQVV